MFWKKESKTSEQGAWNVPEEAVEGDEAVFYVLRKSSFDGYEWVSKHE